MNDLKTPSEKIDMDSVSLKDFQNNKEVFNRDIKSKVIESQKVFYWLRVYMKDEIEISSGDKVIFHYTPSGEKLEGTFACYSKSTKSVDEEATVQWLPEEDKKVLCIMIDLEEINDPIRSIKYPFIRTLFKGSRWYDHNLLKRDEFEVLHNDTQINYYDIDF